jgi:hypothetical protein
VTDLKVDDATLDGIQGTLKDAAARLEPLGRAVQGYDGEVVGADPLIEALHKMHAALGGQIGLLGLGISELAEHVHGVGTAFAQTDRDLALSAHHREMP